LQNLKVKPFLPPLPEQFEVAEGVEPDESDSSIPTAHSIEESSDEGTRKRSRSEDSNGSTHEGLTGPDTSPVASEPIPAIPIRAAHPAFAAKKLRAQEFDLDEISS
jgi:hypothetical protein